MCQRKIRWRFYYCPLTIADMLSFGQRVRLLRQARGITLRGLAREIGVSPAFVSDMEFGRRFPGEEVFAKLAKSLRRSVAELHSYDTRPPVREIKQIAQSDPAFGWAMRRIVQSGLTGAQLVKFVEAHGSGRRR